MEALVQRLSGGLLSCCLLEAGLSPILEQLCLAKLWHSCWMVIPLPRVTCSHAAPPSWWREIDFVPTRDRFYSHGPQHRSAAVEVQVCALTVEVPQGWDSRNSSRNRSDGNWLLNDSVITQFFRHPHLSISLFGKITVWLCADIGTMQQKKRWSLKWLCYI